jgi:hypothetical protein
MRCFLPEFAITFLPTKEIIDPVVGFFCSYEDFSIRMVPIIYAAMRNPQIHLWQKRTVLFILFLTPFT